MRYAYEITMSIVAGSGMLVMALIMTLLNRASANWPKTQGMITASEVDEVEVKHVKQFHPKIRYEYVVNGKRYLGQGRCFSERGFLEKAKASADISRYHKGSTVNVYYFPLYPKLSVLEPNKHNPYIYGLCLVASVLGFLLAGAFLALENL